MDPSATKPLARLSLAQARRIALAAQGFAEPRPQRPGRRHVGRVLDRLVLVQIDSVNVLARAHYMPLFSRLGPYDRSLLDEAAYHRRRRSLFEYWGHEASLIRLDLHPLLRWRMRRAERGDGTYGSTARFGRERPDFVRAVLAQIEARGPLSARELTEGGTGRGSWWGWSDGKQALEWLFWAGRVTTAARRGFERVYDLPERVLPAAILGAPTPDDAEAQRRLIRIAAQALGVATERDLRDYFRLGVTEARDRIAELVEDGALIPVEVEGWRGAAYLEPAARRPRRIEARALVSPFDPLMWHLITCCRSFSARRSRRGSTSRPTVRRGASSCRGSISSRAPIRRASDRRSARSSAPSPAGSRSTRSSSCRRGRGSISASERPCVALELSEGQGIL